LGVGLLKKKSEKKSLEEAMIWRINVILTNDKLVFGEAVFCEHGKTKWCELQGRNGRGLGKDYVPGTSKLRGAGP
jgi:hypothetical protein